MIPDLEREIRSALHDRVEHVTPDQLRHANSPRAVESPTRRSSWAVVGPILAAACVALIAVAIRAIVTSGGGTKVTPAGGDQGRLTSLIGTSWRLVSVREDGHAPVAIRQPIGASVTFERGGVFSTYDGLNEYQSTYTLASADTILIAPARGTAAGYIGHDPARLAAINGIGAILYTSDQQNSPQPVSAHSRPGQLLLAANGYTLVLGAEGPVPTSSSASSSSSTTTR
jgi:hypothetical protein